MDLDEGELGAPVDGDEEVKLALLSANLRDIDVKVADRVGLELLASRPVALDVGKPGDAVPLQAAMQRRAGQLRDRGLKSVEAIVKREQGMPAKGNDNRFLLKGKNGGLRCRPGLSIRSRGPLPPLSDGLRVHSMPSGEASQALLTMLYRSTDCLCRAGAPVKNLSDSASFCRSEKYAPSISGTKHLLQVWHAILNRGTLCRNESPFMSAVPKKISFDTWAYSSR
jgi:hypothetical protein